jgi:hypothetical protein
MSVYEELTYAPMLITDVFETMKAAGKWFDLSKANVQGEPKHPYVARSGGGNGIGALIPTQDVPPPNKGNCITIGVSTSTVFYQPAPFYTSKEIQVLRHPRLTACSGLALVTLLRQQMGKFQWGNGASLVRLKATKIMVPVTTSIDGEIAVDWDGMERFGEEMFTRTRIHARRARSAVMDDETEPPELRFEPMLITDVFDTYRQSPAWLNISEVRSGKPRFPHVTNSANTNSVAGFVGMQNVPPNPGNAITIGIDTQVAAYQPVPFYGATKVFELRSSRLTEASALLLVTSLKRAMEKFSWGHKASAARLQRTRIMVPVTTGHTGANIVDWDGMERYGKWLIARADGHIAEALR